MIVVADTSVFLNLAAVGQERLLVLLFQQVFAPPEVRAEFERAVKHYPRFGGLIFPQWVTVRTVSAPGKLQIPGPPLDLGETMAIALAIEVKADAVLIDEKAGRRAAEALDLTALGTIGVLVQAKKAGHLPLVAPVLNALASRTNFYLDAGARQAALLLAAEIQ